MALLTPPAPTALPATPAPADLTEHVKEVPPPTPAKTA